MSKEHPTSELAEALEVSRSGYEEHLRSEAGRRKVEDRRIGRAMQDHFERSGSNYGSPRLVLALRNDGIRCGKGRVRRLMRERGLASAWNRKRWTPQTTDSDHSHPIAPNLLGELPAADRPNATWGADITYIATGEGWLYLAGVIDLWSRACIGWACGTTMETSLVLAAWEKAWRKRKPHGGLLHHSDRGSQYASGDYRQTLADCGVTVSMSRKGNCYDNAKVESFWATVKTECFQGKIPPTREEARRMLFEYIESFYNTRRMHSSLGYRSPLEFERIFFYNHHLTNN